MSIQLDLNLAAIVGEMVAPPCESPNHTSSPEFHDDGPATHYAKKLHECSTPAVGTVYPVCARFAAFWAGQSGPIVVCAHCGRASKRSDFITILGPVNS